MTIPISTFNLPGFVILSTYNPSKNLKIDFDTHYIYT